ncbi:MAG: hypothetical protein ACQCXQ_15300 [Verrucomicrobiales bacterium]|nr:hypothetical protein [Verrucomicrobiota bacterium JB025]
MHRLLTTLLLLPATLGAQQPVEPKPPDKISALTLLPSGSQLHGVMFPRYDDQLNLVGTLQARAMTLVNETTVSGENIAIRSFHKDGTQRGRVDLATAWLDQTKGLVRTSENVTILTDKIAAQGSGLCYSFEQARGFLVGPVKTWTDSLNSTAMNTRHTPRRATASLGMALLTLPITAAPAAESPAPASSAPDALIANQQTRDQLRADLDAADAATADARAFLEKAELASTRPAPENVVPNELKPLDVSPGKDDTLVQADNGMFFNADQGLFVFLRNVRVTDPRFELTGANELKIFLEQKQPETTQPKSTDGPVTADFGDVERIIATGAIRLLQKQPQQGKPPVEASGAIFTYHPKTGDITLSGGYPWVKQGSTFMRAKQPNLTLRIKKDGSFTTEGNWELGGKIDQTR